MTLSSVRARLGACRPRLDQARSRLFRPSASVRQLALGAHGAVLLVPLQYSRPPSLFEFGPQAPCNADFSRRSHHRVLGCCQGNPSASGGVPSHLTTSSPCSLTTAEASFGSSGTFVCGRGPLQTAPSTVETRSAPPSFGAALVKRPCPRCRLPRMRGRTDIALLQDPAWRR